MATLTANGKPIEAQLPCSIEDFPDAQYPTHSILGRIRALSPIGSGLERGVYAASSFGSPQDNRFVYAVQTLKRPEGLAPGAVPGYAQCPRRGNVTLAVAGMWS